MYPAERRQEILRLMQQDARVTVAQLAAHFNVSRASIRRDLNDLHSSGRLLRTYGGALPAAVAGDALSGEASFSERQVAHYEEKDRIGRAAAQLVAARQVIFLDGGTTCECVVPYLPGKLDLTVVTYGLNIVNRLVALEGITVILIGGTLHRRSLTLGGVLAQDSMQAYNMRFDLAFLSASGIAADGGITNAGFEEIPIKRRAIAAARQAFLLADSSKVGLIAAGRVAEVGQVVRLITGNQAAPDEVGRLREQGLIVDQV